MSNLKMKKLYLTTVKIHGRVAYRFTVAADNYAEAIEATEDVLEGDDRKYGQVFVARKVKDGAPVLVLVKS